MRVQRGPEDDQASAGASGSAARTSLSSGAASGPYGEHERPLGGAPGTAHREHREHVVRVRRAFESPERVDGDVGRGELLPAGEAPDRAAGLRTELPGVAEGLELREDTPQRLRLALLVGGRFLVIVLHERR